jgi:hypothetical protein
MRMRAWMGGLVLAMCSVAAFANGPGAVRRQVESSLVVKGTVDIDADGRVLGYALDHADKLAPAVKQLLAGAVPHWRFEPVVLDPGTDRGRAPMSVRLVARKLDDEKYRIEVRGAQFGTHRRGQGITMRSMKPPRYPVNAARAGVGGTVYVLVKVGRDGRVEDAAAEQVNLRVIASEHVMTRWRGVLAQAALEAARAWTYVPPTREPAAASAWVVRVPIDFHAPTVDGRFPADYEWQAYVPGPRTVVPWAQDPSRSAGAGDIADAIAGGVQPVGLGLRLITPPSAP